MGAVLLVPSWWPAVFATVATNHLVAGAAGLWPRSTLLGPNLRRLPDDVTAGPRVALTLDDGPDPEITPRVLDLLDARQARATFFCIGRHVERHADLAAEIVRRGHAVGNHSYRHSAAFALLGPRGMRREIERTQSVLAQVTGVEPQWFRAPAGLRNPWLEPVLARSGLSLVSWSHRGFDTVTGDASRVLARLTRSLRSGDILLLHDGSAARRAGGAVVLEVLPRLLEHLRQRDLAPVLLPQPPA
jgi:peptidoglycan/xylan/chitin deacetylase (PgdA/CDA1 family)